MAADDIIHQPNAPKLPAAKLDDKAIDDRMFKGYQSGTSPADLLAEFKTFQGHNVDLDQIQAAYQRFQESGMKPDSSTTSAAL